MRAAVLLVCAAACGNTVPKGGVVAPAGGDTATADTADTALAGPPEPPEVFPADLDVVLRVDLAHVRESLGSEDADKLLGRALKESGTEPEPLLAAALADAEVVWVGVRVTDLDVGDRVIAVRTRKAFPTPTRGDWMRGDAGREGVALWNARAEPTRSGTARLYLLGKNDGVFVSPVEELAVERVLRRGPDPGRAEVEERGLLSLVYRAHRLPRDLEQRFPSLGQLVAGLDRVQAVVEVREDRIELEARLVCRSVGAATRVERFLAAIRTGAADRKELEPLLADLKLEREGPAVELKWSVAHDVLVPFLRENTEQK
jgi:hypothetical protein